MEVVCRRLQWEGYLQGLTDERLILGVWEIVRKMNSGDDDSSLANIFSEQEEEADSETRHGR